MSLESHEFCLVVRTIDSKSFTGYKMSMADFESQDALEGAILGLLCAVNLLKLTKEKYFEMCTASGFVMLKVECILSVEIMGGDDAVPVIEKVFRNEWSNLEE